MARDGFFQQLHEDEILKLLSRSPWEHCARVVACSFWSIVDQPLYTLLRLLFSQRLAACKERPGVKVRSLCGMSIPCYSAAPAWAHKIILK